MKFSIIIPTHNAENEIENAINSVLKQKYVDYEIIVINDCSTDNTQKIVSKYKNIKLINHKKNKKAGGARNTGIKHAQGEYIIFLDSDDVLYNNDVLMKISENIEKNSKPDVIYLGFKAEGEGTNGEYIPNENNSSKMDRIKKWKYANVWDVCWKRKMLIKNRLKFVEEKYFEDFLFYYKAILCSETYSYTDFISIKYNSGRVESITTKIHPNKIKDLYYNLELLVDLYDELEADYKPIFKEIIISHNLYINKLVNRLK